MVVHYRYCRRCGELFATVQKRPFYCDKCRKPVGKIKNLDQSTLWDRFLEKNNISVSDLESFREGFGGDLS